MRLNIYLKIVLLLFAFVLVKLAYKPLKEGFTPKIRQMYRPYLRNMSNGVETFTNNYNLTTLINKLRKWNIY
jgi:hypothetical protein